MKSLGQFRTKFPLRGTRTAKETGDGERRTRAALDTGNEGISRTSERLRRRRRKPVMVNGSPIPDLLLRKLHLPSSSPISSSENSDRPRRRRRKPTMVNSVGRTALRSPPLKTSPPISISDPLLREARRGCSGNQAGDVHVRPHSAAKSSTRL
ncbi:hypothetical protein TIFTF001_030078 [Ficus carica]|uniref:Uncharacterized protein n=1 Tax=Ficus carica TaxID=3494 RepID=A0AA88DTJ1_FICCA|nr:hypothetical protein TIFTF001_030078 [Ficus carica]